MPFKIVRNDITKMQVDAIVNTANPKPVYSTGADSAIYEAAGKWRLLAARKKIGVIRPGEAAVTPGFKLSAKYIIHTVGTFYSADEAEEIIKNCYVNSLRLAAKKKCESIAFPLIASGNYGYPKAEALRVAVSAISDFLLKEDMMVYLVVFDNESFEVSGKLFTDIDSYIDEKYVEDVLEAEYQCKSVREKVDTDKADGSIPYFAAAPRESRNDCVMEIPRFENIDFATSKKRETTKSEYVRMDSMRIPQFLQHQYPAIEKQTMAKPGDRSLDDVIAQMSETFQQRLLRHIDEKGMTDVEVYKKANIDRKLFSKIRCNVDYKPKKLTAVALAVALKLSLDETKDLLARAELALSPSSKFDLIIEYFLEREIYDVYTINMALFKHEQPLLGE